MSTKQNLVKRKFPYIDMLNNQGPALVFTMHDLTVGVFENLESKSPMDVDKIIDYTHHMLRGTEFKEYKQVLAGCKESSKGIYGDQWALGATENLTM